MQVVGVDGGAHPCEVKGAGAGGAVRAGPLVFAVQAGEALAVAVDLAGAVTGALVLAHACLAVTFLGPHVLAPRLFHERRGACRNASGLSGGGGRNATGLARGLARGRARGLTSGCTNNSDISSFGRESTSNSIIRSKYTTMGTVRSLRNRLKVGVIAVH